MFRRLSWVGVVCLSVTALQAGEPAVKKPAEGDPPGQTMEERVAALERQVQTLMQAMVEKDNRIAELQRQLEDQAQRRPAGPTLQFRGTPREMEEMWRNWQRDFFRDDPNEGEGFLRPWRREMPLQRDWPRGVPNRSKPRLGVTLEQPTPLLAERYRNESKTGAFVTQVLPGSVAEKAGIMAGDCITAFDDRPAIEVQDLIRMIQAATPGKHTLTLKRRGEDLKLPIQLGEQADPDPLMPQHRFERGWLKRGRDAAGTREVLVVRTSSLEVTPQLADAMKLTDEQRKKMSGVVSKHAKQLGEEYAEKGGTGRGVAVNDALLKPMIERHVAAAETELKGVLDEKQLETWRQYRLKNNRLSVSRSLELQRGREPEGLDF